MTIKGPDRENALHELRNLVSNLRFQIDNDALSSTDMILSCRRILDLWLRAGGSSTNNEVIGFLGIESQTDHVLGGPSVQMGRDVDRVRFRPGSSEELDEIEDCGRWFLDGFKRDIVELHSRLETLGG